MFLQSPEVLLLVSLASDSATDHWLQLALVLAGRVLRLLGEAQLPHTSTGVAAGCDTRWSVAIWRLAVAAGIPAPEVDQIRISELSSVQELRDRCVPVPLCRRPVAPMLGSRAVRPLRLLLVALLLLTASVSAAADGASVLA